MKSGKNIYFFVIFFKILPKLLYRQNNICDFENSDDCIGKITLEKKKFSEQIFFFKQTPKVARIKLVIIDSEK